MIDTFSGRLVGAAMLGVILMASACSTTPPATPRVETNHREGEVSYSTLQASASEQYQLKQSQHAFGAQPITREVPRYPESLVSKALPLTIIRVKAIVDDAGKVSEVRDLDASSDTDHLAFFNACQAAVKNWTFTPMTVVQESDDGHGNISQIRKNAAFSLDYAFHFELVDGRPQVTAAK